VRDASSTAVAITVLVAGVVLPILTLFLGAYGFSEIIAVTVAIIVAVGLAIVVASGLHHLMERRGRSQQTTDSNDAEVLRAGLSQRSV